MKVSEALKTRRAVKAYDPDFVIPEADIRRLFEYTLLTPSSFNLQHWRFAAVTDPGVKEQLYRAAWEQRHVLDASLDIVVAGDPDAPEKASEHWSSAPAEVRERLVPAIQKFYRNEELKRDEAIRSASLAGMSLMLLATEMGYETCPMIGFDPVQVAEIVKMPPRWIPVMIITVGRGVGAAFPRPGQLSIEDAVFRNTFDGESFK